MLEHISYCRSQQYTISGWLPPAANRWHRGVLHAKVVGYPVAGGRWMVTACGWRLAVGGRSVGGVGRCHRCPGRLLATGGSQLIRAEHGGGLVCPPDPCVHVTCVSMGAAADAEPRWGSAKVGPPAPHAPPCRRHALPGSVYERHTRTVRRTRRCVQAYLMVYKFIVRDTVEILCLPGPRSFLGDRGPKTIKTGA